MSQYAYQSFDDLLDTVVELIIEGNGGGICAACKEVTYGVEPDAERYECDVCGAMAVYGAEQYLLRTVA
jgi:hypothetical protein